MGMSRPSYGRGQGSFFVRRSPPMRNPRMPMPPMNQPQAPSGGGFMSQLASSPMMRRPMPGGPGKGRPRGGLMRRGRRNLMRGGPGKGRGRPQIPMPQQPFMGRVGNNMPQPPFMGRVGNNMPRLQRRLPSNMKYARGFYGGGITDLY